LFGVFDGHGGSVAAQLTAEQLPDVIKAQRKASPDMKTALTQSFLDMEKRLYDHAAKELFKSGTTVTLVIIENNRLWCANVGDSRSILCRGGKPIVLTRDHSPALPEEKTRIEAAGGTVSSLQTTNRGFRAYLSSWTSSSKTSVMGISRVWPAGISVSRTLGDILYKDPAYGAVQMKGLIIPDPDIKELVIEPADEFLIIASDGFWDVVTNENAIKLVKKYLKVKDPKVIAQVLADDAFSYGSTDNITVIVVFLTHYQADWDV
jgi:protein phosphatase 1L